MERAMTSYSSFVREFPQRCRSLLDEYEQNAREKNLEVTLLIAVASSAFTIPFERINPSVPDHIADDRYPQAVSALGRLQNRNFVDWQTKESWKIIEGIEGERIRASQADAWASEGQWQSISPNRKVGTILSIVRNALAHGSIFVFPRLFVISQIEPA
jgi:hypothetical protein